MKLNLPDRVTVVVGGASGIGLACAQLFASEGAAVCVWDISQPTSDTADYSHLVVDISDEESVRSAVQTTQQTLGPIDHLVHAAAIGSGQFGNPFTSLQPSHWTKVLDVNVMGMVHVAHAVSPSMMERRQGTMVFVSSVAGQIGSPTDPPYSASKAANINFAQCMAKDLAPYGIRINSVCPGMVKTPLNRSVWQSWNARQPEAQQMTYEAWAEDKIKKLVPLGRWQTAADIADMIVFLSSDRAAQVTGQTINVDGGYVMHW
jgi:2-hydroxycyclohexanecarboxyl-CoA dehydrogenase